MYNLVEKERTALETDAEGSIIVEYAIITHPLAIEEGISLECFGIRVSTSTKTGQLIDVAQIPNITMSALEIRRIFMLLLKHTVTPVSLYEIMDVYLAQPEHFAHLAEEPV